MQARTAMLRVALIAVAAVAGAVATAGPAAAAGPCSVSFTSSTTGGVVVHLSCSSPTAFINGYGSNSTDANREALLLRQLELNVGPTCSGTSSRAVVGGFAVSMTCGSPTNFIVAFGTTLSNAATESRLLEALNPSRLCSDSFVNQVSGGFRVQGSCAKPTVFFSGTGTTVTGAAENARLASGVG